MTTQRLIACLLAVSMLSGCSYIVMDEPPPEELWQQLPKKQYIPCDSGKGLPIIDTVLATSNTASALMAFTISDDIGAVIFGSGLVGAIVYGISAYKGFSNAAKCKRFKYSRFVIDRDDYDDYED